MVKQGFLRARVNGKMVDLDDPPELDKQKKHTIEVVVDRLVVKRDDDTRRRLADSLETAVRVADGIVTIALPGANAADPTTDETMSTSYACPDCGTSLTEITPRLFSFNSPFGACTACSGLGSVKQVDPERLIPDPSLSIADGAIVIYKQGSANWRLRQIEQLAKVLKFSLTEPWSKLPKNVRQMILHGSGEREIKWKWKSEKGEYKWSSAFKGLVPLLEGKYKEVESEEARAELENYMSATPCPDCGGRRLKKEALAVLVAGRPIDELTSMTLEAAKTLLDTLSATPREREIAGKDPQGDRRPPRLPERRRDRLPLARARVRDALGRRGAAHPARDADRLEAHGRPLRPRRAVDRPPPEGQPQAHRHAHRDARPRQHGRRRGARRGDDPLGRPRRGPRPGRRHPRRRDRARGSRTSSSRPRARSPGST